MVFECKTATLYQNYKSLCVPDNTCRFSKQRSDFWIRITSFYRSQTSPVVLCVQNSVISTRINSLYGSQTSSVVLCMQNSVISIRNTNPYWSHPSSVVFTCKAATFGSELQVSIGPRLRLLICECKTECLDPE